MNIDIQGKSHLAFRARDSNPGSLSIFPGGVGRNIAENLARLDVHVDLISVLGDDDFALRLEESCKTAGVGLTGLVRLKGCPSSRYLCLLDADGTLVGAVSDMDSIEALLPARLAERAALLDAADLVLIDANIPESSIAWLADRYPKAAGKPLLGFDPVSVKKAGRGRAYLDAFAFAKPNRAEAAILAGLSAEGGAVDLEDSLEPEADASARAVIALTSALRAKGMGEAFVSLGNEGLCAEGSGSERWLAKLPEHPVPGLDPVNASGAGDAACAALAWGLLKGASLAERCSLSIAAALIARASESPVNPYMNAARLLEVAKGIHRERISRSLP
jgi:pseudouridine kinase